jgi:hypothetical protein
MKILFVEPLYETTCARSGKFAKSYANIHHSTLLLLDNPLGIIAASSAN